jgi:hypothetical protein
MDILAAIKREERKLEKQWASYSNSWIEFGGRQKL